MGVPDTNRIFEFNRSNTALPDEVKTWAGIKDDTGCFRNDFIVDHRNTTYSGLAEMNDAGCRFSTIADIIAQYPEKI